MRLRTLERLALPLPRSFRLVGSPDCSCSLPEGTVVVVVEGRVALAGEDVVLYRDPGAWWHGYLVWHVSCLASARGGLPEFTLRKKGFVCCTPNRLNCAPPSTHSPTLQPA